MRKKVEESNLASLQFLVEFLALVLEFGYLPSDSREVRLKCG